MRFGHFPFANCWHPLSPISLESSLINCHLRWAFANFSTVLLPDTCTLFLQNDCQLHEDLITQVYPAQIEPSHIGKLTASLASKRIMVWNKYQLPKMRTIWWSASDFSVSLASISLVTRTTSSLPMPFYPLSASTYTGYRRGKERPSPLVSENLYQPIFSNLSSPFINYHQSYFQS